MKKETTTPVQSKDMFTGGEWYFNEWPSQRKFVVNANKADGGDMPCISVITYEENKFTDNTIMREEAEANARLIAESKNMYDILKRFVEWYNMPFNEASISNSIEVEAKAILNRITNKG